MTARRLLRALARPLRLRWIDYQRAASDREIERLRDMHDGLTQRQKIEHDKQVRLSIRRDQIERGYA